IAAAAYDVDQHQQKFAACAIVLQGLHAVVTVGVAHSAALFPRVIAARQAGGVLGRGVSAVLVSGVLPPAVVDNDFILYRRFVEQPRKQFGGAPLVAGQVPFAVGEDDAWLGVGH